MDPSEIGPDYIAAYPCRKVVGRDKVTRIERAAAQRLSPSHGMLRRPESEWAEGVPVKAK